MSEAEKGGAKGRVSPMPHQPVQQTLFRLRVRYRKTGRLAYLGHLEVIHTIERAVRRAGLPYAVTQGFSPHMRVGFSSALPVGTGSTCEYYDVFLTELVERGRALALLRDATAPDLMPDAAGYIDVRTPALTAQITRAVYRVELACDLAADEVRAAMGRAVGRGNIPYTRGKKEKAMDLERTLAAWELEPAGAGALALELDTRCDNEGSLRPEIVLAALDRELTGSAEPIVSTGIQGLEAIASYRVERTAQMVGREDGTFADPMPAFMTSESAQLCS